VGTVKFKILVLAVEKILTHPVLKIDLLKKSHHKRGKKYF